MGTLSTLSNRAANDPSVFTITEKAPMLIMDGRVGKHRFLKLPVPYNNCVSVPILHLLTMGSIPV